ncbi:MULTISPECIES: permease prefix domain 1-containing protein [unclassified Knoellia]|uniref:permease prefix domain 1-containing protein n=1 Tax=Knoellia altitudinis TaxID=3404795 RepID=UPI00361F3471
MTDNRTRTTLTDRYVWTVTRHLPDDVGPDVAQELRGTIADAVDGKVEAGVDPDAAEEQVISELGDPDVLARQYGGRPGYLIGPGVYPDYVRLMRILPAIVLPIVLLANFVARVTTTDENWGAILLDAFLLLLSVAVHLAFWVTLTFAVIEWTRPEGERDRPLSTWKPDQLTAEVPWRHVGLAETLFQALFAAAMAVLVAWQFSGVGGDAIQVLNPDVGAVWKLALIGLFVLDAALALVVWRVGRWTPTLAAVNVASNAAAAILLIWLLSRGELLTDLPTVLGERFGWSTDWSIPTALLAAVIVVITLWDGIESVVKARRAIKGRRERHG